MADLAQDKDSASRSEKEEVKKQVIKHSRTFLDARSEEGLIANLSACQWHVCLNDFNLLLFANSI